MSPAVIVLAIALQVGTGDPKAEGGGREIVVQLTGAAERPAPGDPDGTGTARVRIKADQGQLCYSLTVAAIEPATAAHIHRAPPTAAGPIVIGLLPPTGGSSEACMDIGKELAVEILTKPADFYVNVHNAPYTPGAIRGQLSLP